MRKILKKKTTALMLAISLLAVVIIPQGVAMARGHIDVDKKCSLKVNISEEWADLKTADFSVKLYKVASVDQNGVYNVTDDFSKLESKIANINSETTADEWSNLAESATEIMTEGNLSEYKTVEIVKGNGKLEDVDTGLYLVYAEDAKSVKYGYSFVPYLLAAPNNIYATSGSGDDSWIYEGIDISLKPEQYELKGDLEITKILTTYNKALGVPLFVFDVEAFDEEGKVVFSDVVSIAFDSAGTRKAIVQDIPAGAKVTVTEVYAGASYEITSDSSLDVTIVAEDVVGVDFTNDYNDHLIYGTGVVNHFEYDGVGWTWHQLEDNE